MSKFDEYIVHGEPRQREKADFWQTEIRMQDVDDLKVSPYLVESACDHIESYSTKCMAAKMEDIYSQVNTF